jgi:hypothetical protein
MTYTVTLFDKAYPHVQNCLLKKAHIINKNIDGFYAKTTQEDSARFMYKLKKDVKPTYSIFQHVSIIMVPKQSLGDILCLFRLPIRAYYWPWQPY